MLKFGHDLVADRGCMRIKFGGTQSRDRNSRGRKLEKSGQFWTNISWQLPILMKKSLWFLNTLLTIFLISDANLPLFGEIRRFFDQMGHFCELSRTDEKNLGVLGE